jgi:hypothetical protein
LRLIKQIKDATQKPKHATQVVRVDDTKLKKMLKKSLGDKGTSDGKMVVTKIK